MSAQLLTEETVPEYLASKENLKNLVDLKTATVSEIGDGNLNLVFRVKDAQGHSLIIKQTLPYVRGDHSWEVTEDSIFAEARGLEAANAYAPGLAPKYYGLDEERRLVVMEDLSDWTVWRTALNNKQEVPAAPFEVGRYIAKFAFGTSYFSQAPQKVQRAAAASINPDLEIITEDLIFTEPYYEHEHNSWDAGVDDLAVALRSDALRSRVGKLKYEFLTNGEALLHGDLHSGSVFVHPGAEESSGPSVKVFDFEFGFYGPVSFDIGILFGNYLLAQARAFATHDSSASRLLDFYTQTWRGFESEFRSLWTGRVNDIFTDDFVSYWLQRTLRFAAGYAGAEGIRRTVGWAKLSDIQTLDDEQRVAAVRLVLQASRDLIEKFDEIDTPEQIAAIVANAAKALADESAVDFAQDQER